MRKLFITIVLSVVLFNSEALAENFVGKILYKNSFTDLKGNDITSRLAPVLGLEQHYFTDGENYKALDEKNNWLQLFLGKSNSYYFFSANKSAQKIDVSAISPQKIKIIKLDQTEKIAGYNCNLLQVEKEDSTTIYYYSSSVKIDPKLFANHYLGEWNQYLEASEGALALKFVIANHKAKYIWQAVATQVTKLKLTRKDFEFPGEYKLTNK